MEKSKNTQNIQKYMKYPACNICYDTVDKINFRLNSIFETIFIKIRICINICTLWFYYIHIVSWLIQIQKKYGRFPKLTVRYALFIFRNNSQQAKEGEEQLSSQTRRSPLGIPKSQGLRETCRDALGCVFVILVSILVYFTDSNVAKYIDPLFAIISAISLFALSYSYSKY